MSAQKKLNIGTNRNGYRVDGEIGRFEFDTHTVIDINDNIFNTSVDFFPRLRPKEHYLTTGFKELAMTFGDTDLSFRKASNMINRTRYQDINGTPYRTLHADTEREGAKLINWMEGKTKNVLKHHQFSENGEYIGSPEKYQNITPTLLDEVAVKEEIQYIAYSEKALLNNPVSLENPAHSVNISIDDIVTKRQKEVRCKTPVIAGGDENEKKRKYVHNTVVRIDKEEKKYSLVGSGMRTAIRYLIAFLLTNRLVGYHFVFFTDGQKTLNATIIKCFQWYSNWKIILDWYHLVKKCKELLSMASKGRVIRNEILKAIMPFLWHGLTDQAIDYLKSLKPHSIKNQTYLNDLIGYLDRNKGMIPCYALRKRLGLVNSSAIGEKMNDLIVASRQKHNGMSWSNKGSVALATLTATKLNNESRRWFEKKRLNFRLAA